MTIPISDEDPRTIKALEIAASAGQWLKCRTADGRKAYGIRSRRDADHIYFVTRSHCDCQDFQRRQQACKHILAVELHCARSGSKPMPASAVIDGLHAMTDERNAEACFDRPRGRLTSGKDFGTASGGPSGRQARR
jgi:SWIM zinc finger